jgi:hypothetical protein
MSGLMTTLQARNQLMATSYMTAPASVMEESDINTPSAESLIRQILYGSTISESESRLLVRIGLRPSQVASR